MARSAHHDLGSGAPRPLHVLIVDEEAAELKRTGVRLLEAGYVVSTRRGADALFETIARLEPDLVLLDPFLIGLDFAELTRRCRSADAPCVALHSKVLPQVLHGAISFKDIAAVIHKSDDDRDFHDAFQELTRSLLSDCPGFQSDSPPATSGTHYIGPARALPFESRARRRG